MIFTDQDMRLYRNATREIHRTAHSKYGIPRRTLASGFNSIPQYNGAYMDEIYKRLPIPYRFFVQSINVKKLIKMCDYVRNHTEDFTEPQLLLFVTILKSLDVLYYNILDVSLFQRKKDINVVDDLDAIMKAVGLTQKNAVIYSKFEKYISKDIQEFIKLTENLNANEAKAIKLSCRKIAIELALGEDD